MATLFVRHKVADYVSWRKAYDEFEPQRKPMGVTSHGVYQLEDDPNDITVYHEFETVAAARAFMESAAVHEVMQKAGVQGAPEVWIADRV